MDELLSVQAFQTLYKQMVEIGSILEWIDYQNEASPICFAIVAQKLDSEMDQKGISKQQLSQLLEQVEKSPVTQYRKEIASFCSHADPVEYKAIRTLPISQQWHFIHQMVSKSSIHEESKEYVASVLKQVLDKCFLSSCFLNSDSDDVRVRHLRQAAEFQEISQEQSREPLLWAIAAWKLEQERPYQQTRIRMSDIHQTLSHVFDDCKLIATFIEHVLKEDGSLFHAISGDSVSSLPSKWNTHQKVIQWNQYIRDRFIADHGYPPSYAEDHRKLLRIANVMQKLEQSASEDDLPSQSPVLRRSPVLAPQEEPEVESPYIP